MEDFLKFPWNQADDEDVLDLNQLVRILETEDRGYAELEDLEEIKRTLLVQGDTVGLESLIRLQESHVVNLRSLEAQRQEFMQQWHASHGSSATPTLGEIIEQAPDPHQTRLKELKEGLVQRVRSLGRHVRGNEVLVEQSLDHVNHMVEIFSGTHEKLAYEVGGKASDLGRRQLLDRSA